MSVVSSFVMVDGISHLDHALSKSIISQIEKKFHGRTGFFIETVNVRGFVPCSLRGPVVGDAPVTEDEVFYAPREGRSYNSRLVKGKAKMVHQVTVIAGPHSQDGVDYGCILYTAFGGALSPKEVEDPTNTSVDESRKFWSEHALIV